MHEKYNRVNVVHLWHDRQEYVALIAIQSEMGPNNGNLVGFCSLLGNIHERCIVLVAQ